MNTDMENSEVQATVWLKQADNDWLGCKVLSNGEIQNIGSMLIKNYQDVDKIKALAKLKTVWKVEAELADCIVEDSEFFSECKDSMMTIQVKETSEYCYIYDMSRSKWMFGLNMSQPLEKLVKFITRND